MIVLFEGSFGEEPDCDGVIVLPDVSAPPLEGLFHEADFDTAGVRKFPSDADEGAVLVEVVPGHVVTEVEEDFVPDGNVPAAVAAERDGGAQEVADAVLVAPVGHGPIAQAVGWSEFADEALLETEAVGPFEAEPLPGDGDLFPEAVFREVIGSGVVTVGVGSDAGIACREGDVRVERVVDAGTDEELLPVAAEVGAPHLGLKVDAPRGFPEGVITNIVHPEVAIGIEDGSSVCGRRQREGRGGDERGGRFHQDLRG